MNNKKVLFCATVDYHFQVFHLPYLQWFVNEGWEVHVAANGQLALPFVHHKHAIPIQRSPFHPHNIIAYKRLKQLIQQHRFQLIHCHTPMGGVLARLAARASKKEGTQVIYTAHGFHFYRGAPLLNWLVYYPLEKILAHMTDCLITINEEDHHLALQRKFKAKRIERVHGVGVDTERYHPQDQVARNHLRKPFGFYQDDFLMFNAAEFNDNKNQQLLIHVLALMRHDVPRAKLLLAGEGHLRKRCEWLARRLGVGDRVFFLGYREDIASLLPLCDVALAASKREGLPVNVMEAMACGLPIVATDIRGHRELVATGENGYLVKDENKQQFAAHLIDLAHSAPLRRAMGSASIKRMAHYSLQRVSEQMINIYAHFGGEGSETESEYHRAYI